MGPDSSMVMQELRREAKSGGEGGYEAYYSNVVAMKTRHVMGP